MEENSELEEGEPHCTWGDDDTFDPDIDLSYIDQKIQNILGHHRKVFEGGVSKEILGAKFGGYGSFLPSHELSPSNCSHTRTPQSSNTPISQCTSSMEGTSQNFQPISHASSFRRCGTASCSDLLQESHVPSGDVPLKRLLLLSSSQVTENFKSKDENSNRPVYSKDQKTLKVRIKMGSNNLCRKNMDIYSGLGLDDSPSSSLGTNVEESGGTNPVSQETADESPTSILQVMTSFPVPGGALLSPLHDSQFCLLRKERLPRDSKHVSSLNGQEHSAIAEDKSVSSIGNRKLLKEKKEKSLGKSARPVKRKHVTNAKNESERVLLKKKLENGTSGGNEIIHNNDSHISLPNPECAFDSVTGMGAASVVSREVDRHELSDRLFSSNLVREDSLESISGQDNGKSQNNGKSRLVVKFSEPGKMNSGRQVLGYLGDAGCDKGTKTSVLLKVRSSASKCSDDPILPSKQKVGKKPSIQVQDEIKFCSERTKPLFGGEKSKGNHNRGKTGILSIKESLKDGVVVSPKGVTSTSAGASTYRSKMQKLKSQKDTDKACVILTDSKDKLTNNQLEKPSSNKQSKKVANQVMHDRSVKDTSFVVPSNIEGRHGTGMIPGVGDPVIINENWVCCDRCQRWRLLPFHTMPDHLPENWLCSMLNWLPGMNRCDVSEEETTKALYALYQLPAAEGPNSVQYDNGPASAITLDHTKHLGQNFQSPDSSTVLVRAKKRAGGNGRIQTSNTTKNHQDTDMDPPPAESNVMKTVNSLQSVKSCKLDFDKSIKKPKEKEMKGGLPKKLEMKKRRGADQLGCGSSKKGMKKDIHTADWQRNSAVDCGKLDLKPNAGCQTEAGGKIILNASSYSENSKCDAKEMLLLSKKKLEDRAQVPSESGSLDVRAQDKRNISLKKRKWQGEPNGHDSKEYAKEQSSVCGLGGGKKFRVQNPEGRNSAASKVADVKSNIRVAAFFSTEGNVVRGSEDVGNVEKGQKRQKSRREITSLQTSNATVSMRRDFASTEVSVAVTSSSSKVSGSCQNRAVYAEVKGSPVESVSSSPIRTFHSYPDKHTSVIEDIFGNDDDGTDHVLVNNNCERFSNGEGSGEIYQTGTARKEKGSSNFRPQPLRFATFDHLEGNVNHKSTHKSKVSSQFGNGHVSNGDAYPSKPHQYLRDMQVIKPSDDEGRGNQINHDNVLLPQKFVSGYFLPSKGSNRSHESDSHRVNVNISDCSSEHGGMKNNIKIESDVDHNGLYCKIQSEDRYRFPERSKSDFHKGERSIFGRRDCERQTPVDSGIKKQVILGDQHDTNFKLCASTNSEEVPAQRNLGQVPDHEIKPTKFKREAKNGMSVLLSFESEYGQSKRECQSVPGSKWGEMCNEGSTNNSCKADMTTASNFPGNMGNKDYNNSGVGHHSSDIHGIKDIDALFHTSIKLSSQNVAIALKEAKELKDYADRLKTSGFDFESCEAYFQSALKFFHGALLLETWKAESGRNEEMTQIQAYCTTAKLCEFCGHDYERRQEMAAASLAYKCMEVAYMRLVYCKQSSMTTDWIELQATFHMTSQGESPSSCASDVDNLNNQMTADKAILSKGLDSLVTENNAIVVSNNPSFIRLLDITHDIDFAMEASRKSWKAFDAITGTLEKAHHTSECITIIKRVIDFSFQDVEGLLHLVRLAVEAINRSGSGAARE